MATASATDGLGPLLARIRATPEVWVGAAGVLLALVLTPLEILHAYSGLPAHPLFLHVPVILVPLAVAAGVVLAAVPRWMGRYGLAVVLLTVASLIGTVLTVGAGKALQTRLYGGGREGGAFAGREGREAALVAQHGEAGESLRLFVAVFLIALVAALVVEQVRRGRPVGLGFVDRIARAEPTAWVLRAGVVGLAALCLYGVVHAGDTGANAVWGDRLNRPAGLPGQLPPGGFDRDEAPGG